jgi:HEAT repeat protein
MRVRTCLVLLLGLLTCGGCRRTKSTDELLGDLKSGEERDRLIAARSLPYRGDDAAKVIPALIASLKDSDGDVRRSAAIALGGWGEEAKDAIPALQAAVRDPDARVRRAASVALARIDPTLTPKTAPGKTPKR